MSVLTFVLRAMALLDPTHEYPELGSAIADVVDTERPLFARDDDKTRTAAWMVAIAYRESTFDNGAVGDNGSSACAFQINVGRGRTLEGWSSEDLRADPARCVSVAYRMLRQSVRIDPAFPLAFYARGPGYRSEKAKRLSRDRLALATRTRDAVLLAVREESAE